MEHYTYTVGELRRMILKEASQEFKPVLGPNVERENKKTNGESYKDSKKRAEDYDGGLKEPKKIELEDKIDGNRTTIEYNPINKPTKEHQENIEAQAKGYTSKLEQDNGNERGGVEMDDKGRILKQFTDARDKREEVKTELQKSGLAARTFPDKVFDKNHLVKEQAKPKTKMLKFKHTRFVNESQMLSRIPEEYKTDGQRIHMVDADSNEYIVECSYSEKSGNVETLVVSHTNKKIMNEQVDKMFRLMGYETPKGQTPKDKINESSEFDRVLDLVRKQE